METAKNIFLDALEYISNEFYIDGIEKFNVIIKDYPDCDLADDAIYNVGLCYFKMNRVKKAMEFFELVIKDYPEAEITSDELLPEFGKTASKSYLGLIHCNLILGNIEEAENNLKKLKNYKDSYVIIAKEKKYFYEIGEEIISEYKFVNNPS